jgi:hypothetical protein
MLESLVNHMTIKQLLLKKEDRQYYGQKNKHWSTKHYTENLRLSNMNPYYNRG